MYKVGSLLMGSLRDKKNLPISHRYMHVSALFSVRNMAIDPKRSACEPIM
jgi:hypothetical protein